MTNEEIVMLIKDGKDVKKNMELLYKQNRGIIRKFATSFRGYADEEDLMQEAYLGLNDAVFNYEPTAGNKFVSYAGIWIKRYMLAYIAQKETLIKIPRNLYWQCKKYNKLVQKYVKNNSVEYSNREMLKELGVTGTEFELITYVNHILDVCSIEQPIKEKDEKIALLDVIAGNVNVEQEVIENVANAEVTTVLWQQVSHLEKTQANILEMRYKRKMTVQEVSKGLNISVSTVREREKRALMALRHSKKIKNVIGFEEKKNVSYYRGAGVTTYKYTGTSSTEYEAIKMCMI